MNGASQKMNDFPNYIHAAIGSMVGSSKLLTRVLPCWCLRPTSESQVTTRWRVRGGIAKCPRVLAQTELAWAAALVIVETVMGS